MDLRIISGVSELSAPDPGFADNPAASLFYLQSVDFTRDSGPETPERTEVETQSFPRFLDAIEAVWQITYASCNVIIRRDVFDKHRGFTHEVRCAEDTDLFLRCRERGQCRDLSRSECYQLFEGNLHHL